MAEHPTVLPRPAAAVVLARPSGETFEVFMVRRHVRSEFVPDVFVFPGGSVKSDDVAAEVTPNLCVPAGTAPTQLGSGFRVAALRECFEEAGVLLARRGAEILAISSSDVERFVGYRDALNHQGMTLAQVARQEELTLATDDLLHWAHWITPEPPTEG